MFPFSIFTTGIRLDENSVFQLLKTGRDWNNVVLINSKDKLDEIRNRFSTDDDCLRESIRFWLKSCPFALHRWLAYANIYAYWICGANTRCMRKNNGYSPLALLYLYVYFHIRNKLHINLYVHVHVAVGWPFKVIVNAIISWFHNNILFLSSLITDAYQTRATYPSPYAQLMTSLYYNLIEHFFFLEMPLYTHTHTWCILPYSQNFHWISSHVS